MRKGITMAEEMLRNTSVCDSTFSKAGALNKTMLLAIMTFASGVASQLLAQIVSMPVFTVISMVSLLVTFIISVTATFKPQKSAFLAPIYAVVEGFSLGYLVAMTASFVGYGTVAMALGMTVLVVLVMAALYSKGIIRASQKMRSIILVSSITLLFGNVIFFVINLVTGGSIYNGGFGVTFTIIISAIGIVLAAFFLILDFDLIDRCQAGNAPSYMEWFCALNIMITIVWIFVDMLRLLTSLANRAQD